MNVKSVFEMEEETPARISRVIRGGCGTTLDIIAEAARVEPSKVPALNFFQKLYKSIGWKTQENRL
jgi:hypothetical protein